MNNFLASYSGKKQQQYQLAQDYSFSQVLLEVAFLPILKASDLNMRV